MNPRTLPRFGATRVVATLFCLAIASAIAAPPAPSDKAKAELAPGGTLRVGLFTTSSNYVTQGLPPGELRGVAVDIAKALAEQLGAKLEAVSYTSVGTMLSDAKLGRWDIAFMGIDPARAGDVDFSVAYMQTDNSYLVPAGSGLKTIADVDRAGVKVGAADRTVQLNFLRTHLKQAQLVAVPSVSAGADEFAAGKVDALAAGRDVLETLSAKVPGSRVIPGTFFSVRLGLAVPKGRPAGAAYAAEFIRHMKDSGAVAQSISNANLRGATVPRD